MSSSYLKCKRVCELTMNHRFRLQKSCCVFVVIVTTILTMFHFLIVTSSLSNWNEKIVNYRHEDALRNGNMGKRWVVISVAVSAKMQMLGYVFCLPLTVAAWKRIGWHSMILVTGDINHWNNSPILNFVKQATLDLDPTARFVTIPVAYNPVSYAQVSRLFSVLLARWIQPDDIIMTSDIDIVPLKKEFYDIVKRSKIYILNADCCDSFPWRGKWIKKQPMTSIGMSARNWIQVMDLKPLQENETFPTYVNTWLETHYGKTIQHKNVERMWDEDEEWYLDQRVISIQLHHSNIETFNVHRDTYYDRFSRGCSWAWHDFKNRIDAHSFLDSFQDEHWKATRSLINDIFTQDVANKLELYQEKFVKIKNTVNSRHRITLNSSESKTS